MADGHVPEPAGGEAAVDAVANDLVTVLRQPAGLGRRHGDAGHRGLAVRRSPASFNGTLWTRCLFRAYHRTNTQEPAGLGLDPS